MKRKNFLQTSAAVLSSAIIPSSFALAQAKKTIRIAHLTDIHVKTGAVPEAGMAKALNHVQKSKNKIDFIINGGDGIMDALEVDKPKAMEQWQLFNRILKNENSLPIYHTIGNHDVWGWFIKKDKPVDDPLYGKGMALESYGMKNRYYTFTEGNWMFIVLDSTQLNPAGGYIGKLDQEQFDWLQEVLLNAPEDKFICMVSHIPILSICSGLFFDKTEPNGDLMIKRNLMHSDFLYLKKIFNNYSKIKVCISGHVHLQDEVDYLGIKYYCNGAVCGSWWHGPYQEFDPAYAIVELYEDGSSKRTMVKYL